MVKEFLFRTSLVTSSGNAASARRKALADSSSSYPLNPEPTPQDPPASGTSKRSSITSHENPSNGTLVLGHTSLLTTFFLTEDEKYVISADRDEHIRVSWYPQGYVIERFCLGHKK